MSTVITVTLVNLRLLSGKVSSAVWTLFLFQIILYLFTVHQSKLKL